jgi:MFS family permease
VQLGSAPALRGRVMALYLLVFTGGTPIGAPLVGGIASAFGARAALVLCGVVTGACVLGVAAWTLHVRALRLEPHLARRRPHVHVRVGDAVSQ